MTTVQNVEFLNSVNESNKGKRKPPVRWIGGIEEPITSVRRGRRVNVKWESMYTDNCWTFIPWSTFQGKLRRNQDVRTCRRP